MATAYAGSNNAVKSAVVGVGAIDLGQGRTRHHQIPAPITVPTAMDAIAPMPSPQPSPNMQGPPPNPPFVFPSRPSPSSAPSSLSRATGHRSRPSMDSRDRLSEPNDGAGEMSSQSRPRRSPALPAFSFNPGAQLSPDSASNDHPGRSPALPDFSFNPGASLDPEASALSPPLSPSSPRPIPNRGGHRRGGSEFVGGKLREGESITLMSTSPTKSESGFASPALAPVDKSARRGRHQHRRSAAISSHDLSMILKPPGSPSLSHSGGNSAPTSPALEKDNIFVASNSVTESTDGSEPAPKQATEAFTDELSRQEEVLNAETPPTKPASRARVGFSDTLEYIPRPLSMVSTDTASTVTAHHGHSVSGSISSIISLGSSTAPDRDRPSLLSSPASGRTDDSRPSTAGAVLERTPSLHAITVDGSPTSPRRRNSIPLLPGISSDSSASPPMPSPTKVPKRWSFFGIESFASGSPTKQQTQFLGSPDGPTEVVESVVVPAVNDSDAAEEESESIATERKSGKKKQKKVKSWAGSILTRKAKPRSRKTKAARRRSQTPPPPKSDLDDDLDDDEMDISGPSTAPMVMVTEAFSAPEMFEPPRPRRKSEDDAMYPMIDLDAALGPFNTPSGRDPAWEAAQRAGAAPKRRLHSAAGLSGFSGPGMHYHRRAESAPEMPPFEAGRFGMHRFGSSSTMADVFEEDEEDEDEDEDSSSASSSSDESTPQPSGTSAGDVDVRSFTDEAASTPTREADLGAKASRESFSLPPSVKRKGSGSSLDLQPPGSRIRMEPSATSLHDEVIVEEAPQHTAVDQGRIYETYQEGDSASPSPRRIIHSKDLAPVEINSIYPPVAGVSPHSISHSSSFPSPRSPMSYDAHRISTAPSSVTEENNLQSLLMGEPGPEVVRISVDVPSLTSSNSTMTRESNFPPVRPRNMPFSDQRPASFTSTAFGRRRSSLASFSRLISTSHGERSKLSMEVPLDTEPEKKVKISKTKRLSRMMQFWKPKESAAS